MTKIVQIWKTWNIIEYIWNACFVKIMSYERSVKFNIDIGHKLDTYMDMTDAELRNANYALELSAIKKIFDTMYKYHLHIMGVGRTDGYINFEDIDEWARNIDIDTINIPSAQCTTDNGIIDDQMNNYSEWDKLNMKNIIALECNIKNKFVSDVMIFIMR